MNRPVRVVLLSNADTEFKRLVSIVEQNTHSDEATLLKSVRHKAELLKLNPFYGNNIEKKKIPKFYDVQNLWRIELSHFWRMLYTIRGDQKETICFVVDIVDHKKYNKLFNYRKN